jgi:activator of HSP90 ATPase
MILENKKDLSGTASRIKENSKDRGTASSSSTEQKNANQHPVSTEHTSTSTAIFSV